MRWIDHAVLRVPALVLIVLFTLSACRFSPWETRMSCDDHVSGQWGRLDAMETRMAEAPAYSVALISDIHGSLNDLMRIIDRLNGRDDLAFALVLGDLTNSGLAEEFDPVCRAFSSLEVPRFYVIGNHDALGTGREIFQDRFAPLDYAFTFLGTPFVLSNNNRYEFPDAPNIEWIPSSTTGVAVGAAHVPPVPDVFDAEEVAQLNRRAAALGLTHTVHGHRHHFRHWFDEFGLEHYMTNNLQGAKFGLMTIHQSGTVTFSDCTPSCTPVD